MIPREFDEAMKEERRKKFNMNKIQDALLCDEVNSLKN
jgi:hypothetical protein